MPLAEIVITAVPAIWLVTVIVFPFNATVATVSLPLFTVTLPSPSYVNVVVADSLYTIFRLELASVRLASFWVICPWIVQVLLPPLNSKLVVSESLNVAVMLFGVTAFALS